MDNKEIDKLAEAWRNLTKQYDEAYMPPCVIPDNYCNCDCHKYPGFVNHVMPCCSMDYPLFDGVLD